AAELALVRGAAVRRLALGLEGAAPGDAARAVFHCRATRYGRPCPLPPPLAAVPCGSDGNADAIGVADSLRFYVDRVDVGERHCELPADSAPQGAAAWVAVCRVREGAARGRLLDDRGQPLAGRRLACWPLPGSTQAGRA